MVLINKYKPSSGTGSPFDIGTAFTDLSKDDNINVKYATKYIKAIFLTAFFFYFCVLLKHPLLL